MDRSASPRASARRVPRGAVLQDDVTDAITTAFFEELAAVGYGRLSIDAVARRAGVGKAAIYRRWPGKQAMVVALVSAVAIASIDIPDTGTLHGDLRQFLINACAALSHPLACTIVPDLLAEATRNIDLADALLAAIRAPRRAKAAQLLQRAIDRGELSKHADLELGLDFMAGPLYWRLVVVRTPTDDDYFDRLTDKIIGALKA
jgi:AcrR family transcriptional regulator